MIAFTYTNPANLSISGGPGTQLSITKFDGLDAPDTDTQAQKAPYQDGDTWLDERYKPRSITIEGSILLPQNLQASRAVMRSMLAIINSTLGPGTLTVQTDNNTFVMTAQPTPGPKFAWKPGNQPYFKYQILLVCHDPYLYDVTPTVDTFTISLGAFSFPIGVGWAWPVAGAVFSTQATNSAIIANNTGDTVTPITVALGGPCVNPKVTNQTTGLYVKLNLTLSAGDMVTFSTAFGRKTITLTRSGTAPVNAMGYLANGSQFWSLIQGLNSVRFSDDSGSTASVLTLTFSNRYIGM